jgi:hypothetical protein
MENNYQKLAAIVAAAEKDFTKFFDKGNAVAGTRVRKYCMDITNFAKETRKKVTDVKNARKAAASEKNVA